MPLDSLQPLVDRLEHKRRTLVGLVVVANTAVALLLCVLVYSVVGASKRAYQEQAEVAAEGIASVAQLSIGSELGLVDALVRSTAGELQRLRPGQVEDALINEVLLSRIHLMKGAEAFRLTDRAGLVRWGNNLPIGAPMDISDREYYPQAMQHRDDSTIVAGPIRSRVSGNWVVVFVRPIWIDGAFSGILYVSIAADHFHNLLSQYGLEEGDAITLRGKDLQLLARHSPGSVAKAEVGSSVVSDELKQEMQGNPRAGSFVSRATFDGEVRTSAYRAVEGWPFTVLAGIGHSRFFKAWQRQAWQVSLLVVLSWSLVALATVMIYRSSANEARAMQAMADQSKRTQTLLRVAGDGIHIVDRQGRLVEMSDSFAEMLRYTRQELLGQHIWEWDANQSEVKISSWLATLKDKDHQRVDVQHRRKDGTVIDVELQIRVAKIGGVLLVFGSARDGTEVKRLIREQTAMLESDLVGMAKVENRIFTWRNAAFERLFGYAPGELAGQPARIVHLSEAVYQRAGEEAYGLLKTGAQYRTQMYMRKKDGEQVWVDLGAVSLGDSQIFIMAIDATAEKHAHEQLSHDASHDSLTQLPNRVLLADRLRQALASSRRSDTRVAVCYMDLDGFKAVNDVHGHDVGDELLKEVSQRLLANLRPSDTAARVGGDEFVLVLTDVAVDEWRAVLDRVVLAVEQPFRLANGALVNVGATIGMALSNGNDSEADLLDRADRVMLVGKKNGKGRILQA